MSRPKNASALLIGKTAFRGRRCPAGGFCVTCEDRRGRATGAATCPTSAASTPPKRGQPKDLEILLGRQISPCSPRLSVIGFAVPGGSGFFPSTVNLTPPGLPSLMSTAWRKVHDLDAPATT